MWDGFWMLANRRAWAALPKDAQEIVAKNWNAAALAERQDTEKLNANLQQELTKQGLTFNQPDTAPFREALRKAGFYAQWKGRFGDEAWNILEQSTGKLT
jgi:TRAP-type C4-dicarboxylate transport system substrate-binding protein